MPRPLLMRACTQRPALAMRSLLLRAPHMQHVASLTTYRAGAGAITTRRMPSTQLQSASNSNLLLLLRRDFWKRKPSAEELAEVEAQAARTAAEAAAANEAAAQAAAEAATTEAAAAAHMRAEREQQEQQSQAQASQPVSVSIPVPTASVENKAERLGFALSSLNLSWARVKTYGIYLAVGTGVLVVFKAGLSVIDFLASVSFMDVGEVAFVGGLLTGVGAALCAWAGTRFLRLRPEPCFKHALQRLAADSTVALYMGPRLTPSEFRAYNVLDGRVRINADQPGLKGIYKYWQPKRLQMMFQVNGSNGVTGMATAEVEKNWRGDHKYNMLSIDLIDGRDSSAAERIILEGDPSYKIYKGIIKLR